MTKREKVKNFVKENKKEIVLGTILGLTVGGLTVFGGYRLGKKYGYSEGLREGIFKYGFDEEGDGNIGNVFKSLENHKNYSILTDIVEDGGIAVKDLGELGKRALTLIDLPDYKFTHFVAIGESLDKVVTE